MEGSGRKFLIGLIGLVAVAAVFLASSPPAVSQEGMDEAGISMAKAPEAPAKWIRTWLILNPPYKTGAPGDANRPKRATEQWLVGGKNAGVLITKSDGEVAPSRMDKFEAADGSIYWWTPVTSGQDVVSYNETFGDINDVTVYSHLYVKSPVEQKVFFRGGSDDSIEIYLNGERVLRQVVGRGWGTDQFGPKTLGNDAEGRPNTCQVTLKAGWNRILVKVEQGVGGYGHYFMICDENLNEIPGLEFSLDNPDRPFKALDPKLLVVLEDDITTSATMPLPWATVDKPVGSEVKAYSGTSAFKSQGNSYFAIAGAFPFQVGGGPDKIRYIEFALYFPSAASQFFLQILSNVGGWEHRVGIVPGPCVTFPAAWGWAANRVKDFVGQPVGKWVTYKLDLVEDCGLAPGSIVRGLAFTSHTKDVSFDAVKFSTGAELPPPPVVIGPPAVPAPWQAEWLVLGPISNPTPRTVTGLDRDYVPGIQNVLPAEGVEMTVPDEFAIKGALPYKWMKLKTVGGFDLNALIGTLNLPGVGADPNNVVAYSHLYVYSPVARTVYIRGGSDDGIAIWLNGQLVLFQDVWRGWGTDQYNVPVTIGAGWNRFLTLVTEGGGGWGFYFQIHDGKYNAVPGLVYSADMPKDFAPPVVAAAPSPIFALVPGKLGDVALYTNASWLSNDAALREAKVIAATATTLGRKATIFEPGKEADLAAWAQDKLATSKDIDVIILFGRIPGSIYPNPNKDPAGSIAKKWVDAGKMIINTGDWFAYVADAGDNNGPAGAENILGLPGIITSWDNLPMYVTTTGKSVAPILGWTYLSNRPVVKGNVKGPWKILATFAENMPSTHADALVIRNVLTGGMFAQVYAVPGDALPRGAAISQVLSNWLVPNLIPPHQGLVDLDLENWVTDNDLANWYETGVVSKDTALVKTGKASAKLGGGTPSLDFGVADGIWATFEPFTADVSLSFWVHWDGGVQPEAVGTLSIDGKFVDAKEYRWALKGGTWAGAADNFQLVEDKAWTKVSVTIPAGAKMIGIVSLNGAKFHVDGLAIEDPRPLEIAKPTISAAPTSISFTWTTNKPATTVLKYGTAPDVLDKEFVDKKFVTEHIVLITGLTERTTYYYQISGVDMAGNEAKLDVDKVTTPAPPADWVREWLAVGPINRIAGVVTGLEHKYIEGVELMAPAEGEDVTAKVREDARAGRTYKWTKISARADGVVEHNAIWSPNDQVVAYSHVYVWSPVTQTAWFRGGSDDGIAIWLNGSVVVWQDVWRGWGTDQFNEKVTLNAGWNRVLTLNTEGGGGWGFLLMIHDGAYGQVPGIKVQADKPADYPVPVPTITVDGDLSDWPVEKAAILLTGSQVETYLKLDLTAGFVYVGIKVTKDPKLIAPTDSVTLFFDLSNNKTKEIEPKDDVALTFTADGKVLDPTTGNPIPGIDAKAKALADGYSIEAKVPVAMLPKQDLETNPYVGFNMRWDDFDGKTVVTKYWKGEAGVEKTPDKWGTLLIDLKTGIVSVAPLPPHLWIRDWLVLGPLPNPPAGRPQTGISRTYVADIGSLRPSEGMDTLCLMDNKTYKWEKVASTGDMIDHDAYYGGKGLPNDNVAAISTTYVWSDEEKVVWFRGGSDDGIGVWLNGDLVVWQDVWRGSSRDQYNVPVKLRKGWNAITTLVCEGGGGWNFYLGIHDGKYGAVPGLKVSVVNPGFPTVSIDSPKDGDVVKGTVSIKWKASGKGTLAIDIDVSNDGGITWQKVAEGLPNTGSFNVDTTKVPDGPYLLRVSAVDKDLQAVTGATVKVTVSNAKFAESKVIADFEAPQRWDNPWLGNGLIRLAFTVDKAADRGIKAVSGEQVTTVQFDMSAKGADQGDCNYDLRPGLGLPIPAYFSDPPYVNLSPYRYINFWVYNPGGDRTITIGFRAEGMWQKRFRYHLTLPSVWCTGTWMPVSIRMSDFFYDQDTPTWDRITHFDIYFGTALQPNPKDLAGILYIDKLEASNETPWGWIEGVVTDKRSGKPIAGATVEVRPGGSTVVVATATTGADGSYRTRLLFPFSLYNLTFSHKEYLTDDTSVVNLSIKQGVATTGVNVALEPNVGTITGVVTDKLTKAAIAGAKVEVFPAGGFKPAYTATTDSKGEYKLEWVVAGDYDIVISKTDTHVTVKKEAQTLEKDKTLKVSVALVPRATITATKTEIVGNGLDTTDISYKIVDPDGNPMEGNEVSFTATVKSGKTKEDKPGTFSKVTVKTLATGVAKTTYTAAFVPTGEAVIVVKASDKTTGLSAEISITLKEINTISAIFGGVAYALDDPLTQMIFDADTVDEDVRVEIVKITEAGLTVGYEFKGTKISDGKPYTKVFKRPATVQIHLLGAGAKASGKMAAPEQGKESLALFDGVQWVKVGGATYDAAKKIWSGKAMSFGKYGVKVFAPIAQMVAPNPFTPGRSSGDGVNDVVRFFSDALQENGGTVKIFTLSGALVRTITANPGDVPEWDGKTAGGDPVESGVYIYQITAGGQTKTGIIIVAR
jgi:hypothetical protein